MAIRQRKVKGKSAKVIWRISASSPLGEYVRSDLDELKHERIEPKLLPDADDTPPEVPERGWHHSTHDLAHGLDMSEQPLDTLPDDLWNEFFKK